MLSSYTIEKMIGKGSYGHVYKIAHNETHKIYAMKKVNINSISHYNSINMINELRILATHKCPFIVRFKTAFVDGGNMYIITEYACKGDLSQIIKKNKAANVSFQECEIWSYFLQTCVALSYLHNLKIIHRDLKPANIFIDKDDNVKLGDFGIVKIMKSFMMYGQTQIGTPLYMCPEIYKCERYDTKVDIWSLGCVLYETITYKTAFNALNIVRLKQNIFEAQIEHVVPNNYSKPLLDLLHRLICVSPRQRPTIISILNTKFIHEQMRSRNLSNFLSVEVQPSFYTNCAIPKNIVGWNNVVNSFVACDTTIKMNKEEQSNIDVINKAKCNLHCNAESVIEIDLQINKLHDQILKALEYIRECENQLNKLQERKKTLQPIFPIRPPTTNAPKLRPPRKYYGGAGR